MTYLTEGKLLKIKLINISSNSISKYAFCILNCTNIIIKVFSYLNILFYLKTEGRKNQTNFSSKNFMPDRFEKL